MIIYLLIGHVCIALSSVFFSLFLIFKPSILKFYIGYSLVFLTLVSGTLLVVLTHQPLLSSCEAGLTYLVVVSVILFVSRKRFIAIPEKEHIQDK